MAQPLRFSLDPRDRASDLSARITIRRAPPPALLEMSRVSSSTLERPTKPAPYWVEPVNGDVTARVRALVGVPHDEPEPRQTTPSMVRFASDVRAGRRRWFAALMATMLIASGAGAALVFASADAAVVR
jgi:hypothetical protein